MLKPFIETSLPSVLTSQHHAEGKSVSRICPQCDHRQSRERFSPVCLLQWWVCGCELLALCYCLWPHSGYFVFLLSNIIFKVTFLSFRLYIGVQRQKKAYACLQVCYHYVCKMISRNFYSKFFNSLDLCIYMILHFLKSKKFLFSCLFLILLWGKKYFKILSNDIHKEIKWAS